MDEPEDIQLATTKLQMNGLRELTQAEHDQLEEQDKRLVTVHQAKCLEKNAKKHWDLFYKRNETRFFKDRHWTTREFKELLDDIQSSSKDEKKTMFEVGCGVGNLVFPLLEDGLNMFVYACDLSERAIDFVKAHSKYNENNIKAFQCDITTDFILGEISPCSVDIITMIFVLSAINPDKFHQTLRNLLNILKPGGTVLFRDYGLHDMAQLRFKPGHKISENFYMRQDGTRSYYFSEAYLAEVFSCTGYEVVTNNYVHRRTINKKEDVDVPRVFIQGKFRKPT